MDNFVFSTLNLLKHRYDFDALQSLSIEVKIVGSNSFFYFSILIKESCVLAQDCDEVVIEIRSKDGFCYEIDVSDSRGEIYYQNQNVKNYLDMSAFIEEAYLTTREVLGRISKE